MKVDISKLEIEDCTAHQPCATCDLFEECITDEMIDKTASLVAQCCMLGNNRRFCRPKPKTK